MQPKSKEGLLRLEKRGFGTYEIKGRYINRQIVIGLLVICALIYFYAIGENPGPGELLCLLGMSAACFYVGIKNLKKKQEEDEEVEQILTGAKKLQEYFKTHPTQRLETNIDDVIKQIKGGN